MASETTRFTLGKDTLLPASAIVSILLLVLGGWRYMEDRFVGLQTTLDKLDRRLERLEESEKRTSADRWTYTNQQLWVSEFRRLNPQMSIPEAKKNQ